MRTCDLWDGAGELIDHVTSYTALRSIAVQGDRFLLNGRPLRLRMVLDQGYWPESGLTAPDDDALRRDVELAKAMGFNGVRKHQKIEDPRYLYWADTLGLLVWEEMPSAYRFTKDVDRARDARVAGGDRAGSEPPVHRRVGAVQRVVGRAGSAGHRRATALRSGAVLPDQDASIRDRPVIGNDGWESVATDIITIHDYDDIPERMMRRYASPEAIPNLFRHALPAGRLVSLTDDAGSNRPIMLTEFGGLSISAEPGAWGYSHPKDVEDLAAQYTKLLAVVRSLPLFAGFCYTQFTDTYQETNGLLYPDRTPKLPIEMILAATSQPLVTADFFHNEDGPPC